MIKRILRIAAFVLSFAAGFAFVSLLASPQGSVQSGGFRESCAEPDFDPAVVRPLGGDIELRFREFVFTEDGLVADFEAVNNSAERAVFRAYGPDRRERTVSPLPFIRLSGEQVEEFRCGTGLMDHELKPGESRILRFYALAYYWEEGKSIQVGYYFKKTSDGEFKLYWSEDLPVSGAVARQLIAEKSKTAR